MKKILLISFLFVCSIANAQIYYYQSGSPTDPSNWNTQLDGSGAPALDFTAPTDYIIPTGRTAHVFTPWNFGAAGSKLRVYAGATLRNDIGILINSNAALSLDSGSLYINNNESNAALTIFNGTEIFSKYSTVRIDDWSNGNVPVYTGVNVSAGNYYFGNLQINWISNPGVRWEQRLTASSPTFCENNFIMDSIGTGHLIFHGESFNSGHARVIIKGDFIQNGGEISLWSNFVYPEIYPANIELYKNFIQNGGVMGANYGSAFGKITFAKQVIGQADTAYQTYYTYDPTLNNLPSMRYDVNPWGALRLMSDMYGNNTDPKGGLYVNGGTLGATAALDLQKFQLKNAIYFKTEGTVNIYLRSSQGFKNGNEGNIPLFPGLVDISQFSNIIFAGIEAQITGSDAPDFIASIFVSNSSGVTLSKNVKAGGLYFTSGKLNLSDYNLIIPFANAISGENQNNFINTNGTGVLKSYISSTSVIVPIGNGTYSPVLVEPIVNAADTFSFRVTNNFTQMPSDTSYCIKKSWEIVENNLGGSTINLRFQWMRTDETNNFKTTIAPFTGYIGVFNPTYNGYVPKEAFAMDVPFSGTSDTSIARSAASYLISGYFTEFNPATKYIVGTERGVKEYYFYNSNNAASLNNWKKNEDGTGSNPVSFDRYAIFNIQQNKNAVFNSSVTFSNKTEIRVRGNGQFTANQPVTNLGMFNLFDSATYNHNNIGIVANTIFAGKERFLYNSRKCNVNILMWSDTAHALRSGLNDNFANLTINFTNLADPGLNGRWRNGGLTSGGIGNFLCMNLNYIQSSGYDFCPIGDGYNYYNYFVDGILKLGDSILAPDANPVINLSYGTSKSIDSSAGALSIGGDLDIQRGGIHSEQNIFTAKGRLIFQRGVFGKTKHYISSYQPLDVPVFNCGTSAYPNIISQNNFDTLVLRSNFYNSQNSPWGTTDIIEVQSRTVLDCDTFSLRGMGIRVKPGGKIIIRNKQGMNFELHPFHNITLEPGAMIELAGYETQNLFKAGSTAVLNIPNLVINNQSGINLNEIVTVTDTLKFIQGKVNSSLVNLYLTDTTASIGMNEASYIDAPIRLFTTSTMVKMIPFGKNGKLRPLYFQPAATNPTQWVMWFDTQDPHLYGSTMGPGITSISNNEYYEINRIGSTIGAYVGLSFGQGSGVSAAESLRVARWTGIMWENKGAWYYTGVESGYVMSEYVSDFSPFVIATTNQQPLPVELASFNASIDRNNVNLAWTTAHEINNSGFDVERKLVSDSTWHKISFIQGNGNSNQMKTYKFDDRNLSSGKYNYRLKQIDHNGNFSYFNLQNELSVGIPNEFALSQNYPNPFNPATKIDYDLPRDSKVSLKVYDMLGREIASIVNNELQRAGYYNVQFNAVNFASGTYFFRIIAQGDGKDFVMTKKMQLIK